MQNANDTQKVLHQRVGCLRTIQHFRNMVIIDYYFTIKQIYYFSPRPQSTF